MSAAANFRMKWDEGMRGGVIGPLVTGIEWLIARKRTRLPGYSYVAVDGKTLYIAELRYGTTISLRRVVGTWDLWTVRPEPLETVSSIRLKLGERTVELEASDPSSAEAREVVRMVLDGQPNYRS